MEYRFYFILILYFIQCALSALGLISTFQKSALFAGKHGLYVLTTCSISELLSKYSSNICHYPVHRYHCC
jgi:hypothetical protein